jgi:GntR family carbon starvation induced transcriptional regulator
MQKEALAKKAYNIIKKAIINNAFEPGEKLSISHLKNTYYIGLCPLREALARLKECGLLESSCMKGYRVPAISVESMTDIYRARIHIDTYILELAIENATEEDVGRVIAAAHQLKTIESEIRQLEDFSGWQDKHKAFISALMAGCYSPSLISTHDRLYQQTERYRGLWFHWSFKHGHPLIARHANCT